MMRFARAFALVLLALSATAGVRAHATTCLEPRIHQMRAAIQTPLERFGKFKDGDVVRVQLKGSPLVVSMTYGGIQMVGGELYVELRQAAKGNEAPRNTRTRFRGEDIFAIEPELRSKGRRKWNSLKADAKSLFFGLNAIGAQVVTPHLELAKGPGILVVGGLTASKELASQTVRKIGTFDDAMTALGFVKPEETRVILNDKPILPFNGGPAALAVPLPNVLSAKALPSLHLSPFKYDTRLIREEGVVYHERMHNLLQETYRFEAFVNQSRDLQEGLCDFAAAHTRDNPVVLEDFIEPGIHGRDIESRTSFGKPIDDLMDVSSVDYHQNSLLISNVLWGLRKRAGKDAVSGFLKPFIDKLNDFRPSFEQSGFGLGAQLDPSDARQVFAVDFVYFLSVLRRSTIGTSLGHAAELEIRAVAERLGLQYEKIDLYSMWLKPSGRNFKKVPDLDGRVTTAHVVLGVGTLAIEGAAAYGLGGMAIDKGKKLLAPEDPKPAPKKP